MTAQDGKHLLESWLKLGNRSLTASQMFEVLDAFNECPYPLFLKVCTGNRYKNYYDLPLFLSVSEQSCSWRFRINKDFYFLLLNWSLHLFRYVLVAVVVLPILT